MGELPRLLPHYVVRFLNTEQQSPSSPTCPEQQTNKSDIAEDAANGSTVEHPQQQMNNNKDAANGSTIEHPQQQINKNDAAVNDSIIEGIPAVELPKIDETRAATKEIEEVALEDYPPLPNLNLDPEVDALLGPQGPQAVRVVPPSRLVPVHNEEAHTGHSAENSIYVNEEVPEPPMVVSKVIYATKTTITTMPHTELQSTEIRLNCKWIHERVTEVGLPFYLQACQGYPDLDEQAWQPILHLQHVNVILFKNLLHQDDWHCAGCHKQLIQRSSHMFRMEVLHKIVNMNYTNEVRCHLCGKDAQLKQPAGTCINCVYHFALFGAPNTEAFVTMACPKIPPGILTSEETKNKKAPRKTLDKRGKRPRTTVKKLRV